MRAVVVWAMLGIAVDIGLARLGYGLVLPAIRGDLAGSYAAFGLVATLHFAGYLAGSLTTPFVLRRDRTARVTAAASHALVGGALIASAWSPTLAVLTWTRALVGFGCGLGVASVVTGALERVGPARRATVSGLTWSGIAVGLILSAPATPWLLGGAGHWRAGTAAAGALGLVTAGGLWTAFAAKPRAAPANAAAETPFRILDLVKPQRYLLLAAGYFSFGAAYTAYSTFIVAALRGAHASTTIIAVVWTATGVATMIGALTVGRAMSGRYRGAAFAISLAVAGAGSLLSTLPSVAAAVAGSLGVGLGLASSPAIASALARARSSASTGAAAFVAVTTVMAVGQIVGPAAAGPIADHFGAGAVPLLAFAIYALGALAASIDGALQRRANDVAEVTEWRREPESNRR